MSNNNRPTSNNELIVQLARLEEKMQNLIADIKDLKEGTSSRVTDHEVRLRRLELWGAIALGVSYAMQFYFNYLRK